MRRAVKYVISHNYSGWVRVEFNSANAPTLPLEDGYLLAVIPANGLLKTSSSLLDGWGADEYYQLDARGNRKRLIAYKHGDNNTRIWSASTNGSKLNFFCGTKKQLLEIEKYP